MNTTKFVSTALIVVALAVPAQSADFNFGLSGDEEGLNSFYLAIGDHYRAQEKEIRVVREHQVPDDEMPVVFFLARRANVSPSVIVDLRMGGSSWMDITVKYDLSPEIYYVEVKDVDGPPYGHAYGHYKKHPKNKWNEIKLADRDIVNIVNLRFISDHYGYDPSEVIRMRQDGRDFVSINKSVKEKKHGKKQAYAVDEDDNRGKGKGNKKGKGKNK